MPIDPRIALQAIGIQAPDVLGAMAQGQQYRQNQMAQQAAQATAQRNAMIRQRAATTDFTNPDAVNMFVREAGPDATPYLEAAAAGAGLGTARAAEGRAAGEHTTKQNEAAMTEFRTVVGRVWANPDDASLADAAQRYPQFAADINRIAALPDLAARQSALASTVAALPGGTEFLNAVTQQYTDVDLGGTRQRVPNRPYLPGGVQSFTKTPDPNAPVTYLQTAEGYVAAPRTGGPATTVVTETGAPVSRPQPAGRGGQTQENADLNRSRATGIMRDSSATMRGALTTLRDEGFLRSSRDNAATGAGQFIRDAIPGGRGLALSMNPTADAAAQVIQGTRSTMVGQLKDMYGSSSRAMDAVRELELALAQFGAEGGNYDAGVSLLDDLDRRLDLIDRLYREDSGLAGGGGGGNAALVTEARRRGLIQ
jgi:hypothetical protein